MMTNKMMSSANDLTLEWLTDLLRSSGDLDASTSVASVEVSPFGSDESMMSALHRVAMTFDGPTDAPTSLIVKLTSENEGARFIAALFQLYGREIRFYTDLLSQVPINTPRCLLAEMYPDDQGFILVLEQVEGCRQVDQIDGMNFDDALTTVEALAELHVPFWGADLSEFADTILPFDSDLIKQGLPMKCTDDWGKVRDVEAGRLSPEVVAVFDNVAAVLPLAIDDVMGTNTIVHGDSRADNLLFEPDGSVVMLDFQLMGIGNGLFDVAYLVSQSLNAAAQERGGELIDAYVARVQSHGIEVDLDEAMTAYRASVIFNLGLPLSMLASEGLPERSIELARTMLQRAGREVVRTNAHMKYTYAMTTPEEK